VVLIAGGFFVKNYLANRTTFINSSQISNIKEDYTKMEKPLVHGELNGKITGKKMPGRVVSICEKATGQIVKKNSQLFLQCPKSDIKQVSVDDTNGFSQRLTKGDYILNITLETNETSSDVPAYFTIHSSETANIEIKINTK
jgi:hypothetical protein